MRNDSNEAERGKEDSGELVIARGDAAGALEPSEAALGDVAGLVGALVVAEGQGVVDRGDADRDPRNLMDAEVVRLKPVIPKAAPGRARRVPPSPLARVRCRPRRSLARARLAPQ